MQRERHQMMTKASREETKILANHQKVGRRKEGLLKASGISRIPELITSRSELQGFRIIRQ